MHTVITGATGVGKTVLQEGMARQDIKARHGMAVLDPMGSLFQGLVEYVCYLMSVGYPVNDHILLNASSDEWVLPLNTFQRRDGDIAVQVDRRVSATLRVWGQHSGDTTPRLEKWMTVVYHILIELGLTITEASALIEQQSPRLRAYIAAGLRNPVIRTKFEQLGAYRPREFLEQTESFGNRLMRFVVSGTITRMMGCGSNALNFPEMMDRGQSLLCNLAVSSTLSREQRRLIGALILNEFFESALARKRGARPYYLYIDEAAEFVTPELGEALEQCRQKGLHLNLSFQHLAQFRVGNDDRVYRAVKVNARNKMVFAVPDRHDATELADDLFAGLAEPEIKHIHRHLSHLIEDIRQSSTTTSTGTTRSTGTSRGTTQTMSQSRGITSGFSDGVSGSTQHSWGRSESQSYGRSVQSTTGRSRTETIGNSSSRATTWSSSQSNGASRSHGRSESTSEADTETHGTAATITAAPDGTIIAVIEGNHDGSSATQGFSSGQTETSSQSSSQSHGRGVTRQETASRSSAVTQSQAQSRGTSQQCANATSAQQAQTTGRSTSRSRQDTTTTGHSRGTSSTLSQQQGTSESRSVTDQPGVRHTPFWEEQPEFWTLEERRWRAAESLMSQAVGHCFIKTASGDMGMATVPLPKKFYILPEVLLRFTRELYQRHCLTKAEADALVSRRQAELRGRIGAEATAPAPAESPMPDNTRSSTERPLAPIWNRIADVRPPTPPDAAAAPPTNGHGCLHIPTSAPHRKRGPKPDFENHRKVETIIRRFGEDWTADETLREICLELDRQHIPIPKTWPVRGDGKSRSWNRARENYPHLVVKAIKDRLKAASQQRLPFAEEFPQTSAEGE